MKKRTHTIKAEPHENGISPGDRESRFQQLTDIARSGDDDDNAECALGDLAREFPAQT